MVIYMVLAETVISGTLGAEPEFKLRMVGVGAAAYGALVGI